MTVVTPVSTSVSVTVYPLMMPFLCSAMGGCHEIERMRESVALRTTSTGGPEGAEENIKSKNDIFVYTS